MSKMCTPKADNYLYAVFVLIPLLGGVLSFAASDTTSTGVAWRKTLRKSRLSPGAITTSLTWVLLYVAMGTASFRVYSCVDSLVLSGPVVAYMTQLLLNHFYIIVLFGLQRIDLALAMMVPLWFATAVTAGLFYEVEAVAGRLMWCVLGWVSFSAYLNGVLYVSNPVYTEIGLQTCDDQLTKAKRS